MQKVMIAGSRSAWRKSLESILSQNQEFQLSAVTDSGWELLELLAGQTPDILLMELELNDRSGVEVLSELRKHPELRPGVIFAYSGIGTEQFEQFLSTLGAAAMLRTSDTPAQITAQLACYSNPLAEQEKRARPLIYQRLISELLFTLGIPANVKGYRYLAWSLEQIDQDPELLNLLTKALYPMIGRRFHTNARAAERAMRHAIELACERGDPETWEACFPVSIKGKKPTNGEFLAGLTEALRLAYREQAASLL